MFGFCKLVLALAFSTSVSFALPTVNTDGTAALATKRNAEAAPLAKADPVVLEARQLPATLPDALSTATNLLGPILSNIGITCISFSWFLNKLKSFSIS
jgi:hypothetical protein